MSPGWSSRQPHRRFTPAGREVRRTPGCDLARAYSYLARDDDALDQLLDAGAAAPQIVRQSAAVRDTLKSLHRRGTTQDRHDFTTARPAEPSNDQHRRYCGTAGGVETLLTGLVRPLVDEGHQVVITLTPTAAMWLDHLGEVRRLETLTGLPVRCTPRLHHEPNSHPKSEVLVGRR
jgi:hypothetical protein